MFKHILFDLDGTLLPMVQDEFVAMYMPRLARRFVKWGLEPEVLTGIIWKGVGAMVMNDGGRTNEEAFWSCFEQLTKISRGEIEGEMLDFYNNEFNEAIASTRPTEMAGKIISGLKKGGVKVYLATNPIFPRCATMNRIRWAGLDAEDFEVITTYEDYHFSKPNVKYFKEIMDQFGLNPQECLMAGNDVEEDLSIRELGVKTYLVTDTMENKKNLPINSDYQGSLEQLYDFLASEGCIG